MVIYSINQVNINLHYLIFQWSHASWKTIDQFSIHRKLGLQLAIFIVNESVGLFSRLIDKLFWSIKCQKMVKNVDQCLPKPKMTSSNVLFCPQLKDIQFTVIEE